MKNKKGSVTVYAMFFLTGLLSAFLVFARVSSDTARVSEGQALGLLWGNSVLSEYDLNLQRRYGLFAFYGDDDIVKQKLDFYRGESDGMENISFENSSVSDFKITDTKLLRKQINEAGKLALTDKFVKPDRNILWVNTGDSPPSYQGFVFENLPSEGVSGSISVREVAEFLKNCRGISDVFDKAADSYFQIKYIDSYFKNASDGENFGKTFLENEMEYIICGRHSDIENARGVKIRLTALREVLNLIYLEKNPVKRNEALLAAELITPGPAAAVTAQALMASWALLESMNDYRLLVAGHRVPVMKDESTWATDIDSVIHMNDENRESESGRYIYTGTDKGETYSDYLNLFVYFMKEKLRLMRILDVIQINMKYMYYTSFDIEDYNLGLSVNMKVCGREKTINVKY